MLIAIVFGSFTHPSTRRGVDASRHSIVSSPIGANIALSPLVVVFVAMPGFVGVGALHV